MGVKRVVVVGGYGEMGSVCVRDLVETCRGCSVVVAGRDGRRAVAYARSFRRRNVTGVGVDVTRRGDLVQVLSGASVVVNCTQYYWNLEVMNGALAAGCHYVDLGGLYHMTLRQLRLHRDFKRKRLVAVVGCGSTPGVTNVLARFGARFFDRVVEVHVSFAGFDRVRHRRHFFLPYSVYTLRDEFTARPAVLRNGRIKFVAPLSGAARLVFPAPVGAVTGFYTLHSELATLPSSFGLRECSFRVTFAEDFVHDVRVLLESGLLSDRPVRIGKVRIKPVEVVAKELNRLIPSRKSKVDDLEYIRVVMKGVRKARELEVVLDCVARSNRRWNAPAGSVDTGVPPSVVAQMIMGGRIKEKGVLPPEVCVPPEAFFAALRRRGMVVSVAVRREV